ncbi:histone deacetylase family protein [Deinococcus peraridilitoris]|uniref:Deacetylase, histone deacetylase/acetoin utilization protein n=1 Tax=Deinococcus peraridilitoris (strain DSM 19664 / LMG 22246 / CIP 109416 / KR-200) TaxID=937777 RepID=L0A555_DEIPD|nr:histone deacetylase [Deinococcus peraridilitoris]AFZ68312.1 deacetylase, histone deacetylase/acetoin utilization protein [Deinococcus peraridilitoris DSM 19664]
MTRFRAYTPAEYTFPLPEGHRFPLYKYAGVALQLQGQLPILPAPALEWELAEAVHDRGYLDRWRAGEVSRDEVRVFGLPWSPEVVERARRASGATVVALRDALRSGWGVNLSGGTHHAFFDRAEGFSLLNDVVIAVTLALREGWVSRVAIVDLDVHQGNGTASLLAREARAYTLSVHGERNYPFRKERSSLDIALGDGVSDLQYLHVLDTQVFPALDAFRPDLLVYLAGVDVLGGDRFGRFALTLEGADERSRRVYRWCKAAGVPAVTTMAGGYNRDFALTVNAHARTVEVGLEEFS